MADLLSSACDLLQSGLECLKTVPPGEVLAPWIQATFEVSGVMITVGNQSSPDNLNRAVIKDFEFGISNGYQCKVRVLDEQGGDFVKFMEDLVKDFKCLVPERGFMMQVQFGWIRQGCLTAYPFLQSKTYYMSMETIQNAFSGGCFVYDLIGRDIPGKMQEATATNTYPGFLTEAITQMLTDSDVPPSVANVRFLQQDGITPIQFKISDGDPIKGPYSPGWDPKGFDKLNAALNWLRSYVTNDGKSLYATYNGNVPGGEIIFWENPDQTCDQEDVNVDQLCLGTYIVNSGQDTSVLDFSYSASWHFTSLANAGGAMGEGSVMQNDQGGKQLGLINCKTLNEAAAPSAGQLVTTNVSDAMKDKLGKDSAQETSNAQAQQLQALGKFNLFTAPIEATLTVMGDPFFEDPIVGLVGKFVTIIFLNPYYLLSNGTQCGDWLAGSRCNPVLSNKMWEIRNLTHRIADGKFTTTLDLRLTSPGLNIDVGQPFGGPGSGGWVPPKNC